MFNGSIFKAGLPYFEGWYFKHQKDGLTLCLIPGRSNEGAFVQVITNECSYNIPYSLAEYDKGKTLVVGSNRFARNKTELNINTSGLSLTGRLTYSGLTPLRYDIMGLYRFLPMECSHAVLSIRHRISGELCLNGQIQDFNGGVGYIEADRGRSFPESYTWVQCNSFTEEISVMASAAKIPLAGINFWGCICAVWHKGREYRLATYLGAKVKARSKGCLEIAGHGMRLIVDVTRHSGHKLYAPQNGAMSRTIHENAAVKARFRFFIAGSELFDMESDFASFEYVE